MIVALNLKAAKCTVLKVEIHGMVSIKSPCLTKSGWRIFRLVFPRAVCHTFIWDATHELKHEINNILVLADYNIMSLHVQLTQPILLNNSHPRRSMPSPGN